MSFRFPEGEVGRSTKNRAELEWWPAQWRDALKYRCDDALRTAMELAVSLRRPLLLTGKPGSGKTTAAYWAALKLGKRPPRTDEDRRKDEGVIHAQVRSSTTERTLKYSFDAISFFRDLQTEPDAAARDTIRREKESRYVHKGELWRAFEHEGTVVLLLDEIDKAPPELPNDLLLEMDRLRFEVPDVPGRIVQRARKPALRSVETSQAEDEQPPHDTLIILTSNRQRPLPEAFLRRCLHYCIELTDDDKRAIVEARFPSLDGKLLDQALDWFQWVKKQGVAYEPGLSELLDWVNAVQIELDGRRASDVRTALGAEEKKKDGKILRELPHMTLLKGDDATKILGQQPQQRR